MAAPDRAAASLPLVAGLLSVLTMCTLRAM